MSNDIIDSHCIAARAIAYVRGAEGPIPQSELEEEIFNVEHIEVSKSEDVINDMVGSGLLIRTFGEQDGNDVKFLIKGSDEKYNFFLSYWSQVNNTEKIEEQKLAEFEQAKSEYATAQLSTNVARSLFTEFLAGK